MTKGVYYLDSAATTPIDAEVVAASLPYMGLSFHNPASSHILGQMASMAVERARSRCLDAIGGKGAGELYFTSGGTEAINWAMKGAELPAGSHIVVSAIEHDAVHAVASRLEKAGYVIDTVMPTSGGVVTPDALSAVMTDNTSLVCVMTVNNIVGAVQPVKELAAVAHAHGALFFTDAVQAVNSVAIDVADSGVDMLCVSGHKFYAPKGIGFLYVRRGVKLLPLIDGGSQEKGLRGGTVNVAGAVSIGEAITLAASGRTEYNAHIKEVTAAFMKELRYGSPVKADTPTGDILSVVFDGIDGGRLAVALSVAGVCCSVGSACSAGSATPPPTLVAMGVHGAGSSVRFSFGKQITAEQAAAAAQTVNSVVERIRLHAREE